MSISSGGADEQTGAVRGPWLVAIAPILVVTMIAAAVHGLILPLVALVFDRWDLDADLVGLNAAAGTGGIVLLGPFLPRIFMRFGIRPLVAGAVLAATASLVAMAFLPGLVGWFILKALFGLSLSLILAGAELWINVAVDDAHRGRAFSLFTVAYWLGFGCGPVVLGLVGPAGALPLLIAGGWMLMALAAVRCMPSDKCRLAPEGGAPRLRLPFWSTLLVIATALLGGYGDAALSALLPTFGLDHGFADAEALALLTAFVAGGVLLQWPIGWLADRVNERIVGLGCIAGTIAALTALPTVIHDPALRLPLCFVIGAFSMSISALGLTMVGHSFAGASLAVMSTWFSIAYEVGSTIGPVVAGNAMVWWGAHGLPYSMVAAGLLVSLLFLATSARNRFAGMPGNARQPVKLGNLGGPDGQWS